MMLRQVAYLFSHLSVQSAGASVTKRGLSKVTNTAPPKRVIRIAFAALLVAVAYAALVLFARGLTIAGAVVAAAVVLVGGYLRFVRRNRSEGT